MAIANIYDIALTSIKMHVLQRKQLLIANFDISDWELSFHSPIISLDLLLNALFVQHHRSPASFQLVRPHSSLSGLIPACPASVQLVRPVQG